jgi:ABC-type uncharacterized transport system substrate-binding protein
LGAATPSTWGDRVAAFLQRLRELGWTDGHNIAIEYRWAEGRSERFVDIAAEFVRLKAVLAAKQATSVVPIDFVGAGDPVGTGLVAGLARPGGNLTGLSSQQTDTVGKRLELPAMSHFDPKLPPMPLPDWRRARPMLLRNRVGPCRP